MNLKQLNLQTLSFKDAKNINGGGDKIIDIDKLRSTGPTVDAPPINQFDFPYF